MLGFVRPYKDIELAIDAVALGVERGDELELTVAGISGSLQRRCSLNSQIGVSTMW